MPALVNAVRELTSDNLVPSAVFSSTATATAVDISRYEGQVTVVINTGATSSFTSLVIQLQSDNVTPGTYANVGTALTITSAMLSAATTYFVPVDTNACSANLRVVNTLTGTSIGLSETIVGFPKVQ